MDTKERRILIILEDSLITLANKGELIDRYYNPGDIFDEVHFLSLHEETPPSEALSQVVGRAKPIVHSCPPPARAFIRSLGWRPWLLHGWRGRAVEIACRIGPDLVRCHGSRFPAWLASQIKRELGVPYVVSVHLNADVDWRGRAKGFRNRLSTHASVGMERVGLRKADLVLPVYASAKHYVDRLGAPRTEIAYNVINPSNIVPKTDYGIDDTFDIVSVGRQFEAKDCSNLIRAVARMENTTFTLFGDGPYHERLKSLVDDLGVQSRITFIPALPNDELCRRLAGFDVFATHTEYWEISKSVLEALLTGLPVLLNERKGPPVEELTGLVEYTADTPEDYLHAFDRLRSDQKLRERLGTKAHDIAWQRWDPARCEQRFADHYESLLATT